MARTGVTKPGRGKTDAGDLLPNRLTEIARVLADEIEAPIRARYRLPPKDWNVMKVLAAHGALPPTDIHRVGGQNKAQISRALKCLLDRDLVRKSAHPDDHRTFLVSLTESGRDMYAAIVKQMRRRQAGFLKRLSAGDADRLQALLNRLEDAVRH